MGNNQFKVKAKAKLNETQNIDSSQPRFKPLHMIRLSQKIIGSYHIQKFVQFNNTFESHPLKEYFDNCESFRTIRRHADFPYIQNKKLKITSSEKRTKNKTSCLPKRRYIHSLKDYKYFSLRKNKAIISLRSNSNFIFLNNFKTIRSLTIIQNRDIQFPSLTNINRNNLVKLSFIRKVCLNSIRNQIILGLKVDLKINVSTLRLLKIRDLRKEKLPMMNMDCLIERTLVINSMFDTRTVLLSIKPNPSKTIKRIETFSKFCFKFLIYHPDNCEHSEEFENLVVLLLSLQKQFQIAKKINKNYSYYKSRSQEIAVKYESGEPLKSMISYYTKFIKLLNKSKLMTCFFVKLTKSSLYFKPLDSGNNSLWDLFDRNPQEKELVFGQMIDETKSFLPILRVDKFFGNGYQPEYFEKMDYKFRIFKEKILAKPVGNNEDLYRFDYLDFQNEEIKNILNFSRKMCVNIRKINLDIKIASNQELMELITLIRENEKSLKIVSLLIQVTKSVTERQELLIQACKLKNITVSITNQDSFQRPNEINLNFSVNKGTSLEVNYFEMYSSFCYGFVNEMTMLNTLKIRMIKYNQLWIKKLFVSISTSEKLTNFWLEIDNCSNLEKSDLNLITSSLEVNQSMTVIYLKLCYATDLSLRQIIPDLDKILSQKNGIEVKIELVDFFHKNIDENLRNLKNIRFL